MAGSTYGKFFSVTTWGESHGEALGVVVDGVPAGLSIDEDIIQGYMDRRKPGQSSFTTMRKEGDRIRILSGVFEGKTTGTPISMMVFNEDQRSRDYSNIMNTYRPGHGDYTYDQKYGFRDYRGGGRSSARETLARVAAGAIACEFLKALDIEVCAFASSIGGIEADITRFGASVQVASAQVDSAQVDSAQVDSAQDSAAQGSADKAGKSAPQSSPRCFTSYDLDAIRTERDKNPLNMPDAAAADRAEAFLNEIIASQDSAGGTIDCIAQNLPVGLGEPVFDKLDALLGQALFSIGAVKGAEIGSGFEAAASRGSLNNDSFYSTDGCIRKRTNYAGGVLSGLSDGAPLYVRAAIKPTPSISLPQETVDREGNNTTLTIKGRHDPIIVPRAVVVVEAMCALTISDLILCNMSSRLENVLKVYKGI